MIYATYRLFYGEDFIKESIESIYKHVDKVIVFWTDTAFKGVTGANYKGKFVKFRKPIDKAVDIVREMQKTHPKIEMIYDFWPDIDDQFRHQVEDHILPNFPRPNHIIALESDCVFTYQAIRENVVEFVERTKADRNLVIGSVGQIMLWRHPNYRIQEGRPGGVTFWCLDNLEEMPVTGKAMAPPGGKKSPLGSMHIPYKNHNFGYCISEENMYWNHLVHLGFSAGGVDTMPREDWYDKVWLPWDYDTCNKDLHPSTGYGPRWPSALKYDTRLLPEVIKKKYGY